MNKFLRSILFMGLLLLMEKPVQAHNFKFKQTISEACFSNSSHSEIACFNFEEVNGSACFVVSNLPAANASTNASLLCNNSYSFLSTTICLGDSSLFNAVFYHTTGVYTDTIPNYAGCDSILTFTLNVHPTYYDTINATICKNEYYFFMGVKQTAAGTYIDPNLTYLGCDSVTVLNLQVNSGTATYNNFFTTICSGQGVYFNNQYLTQPGIYSDTLKNYAGCDSFETMYLNASIKDTVYLNGAICSGQSYNFGGTLYSTPGTYAQNFFNFLGCYDSTVVLNLSTSLYAATSSTITTSFCQGSYYLLNGQYYFNAGNFTQQLLNSNGCDSTININLTMIANPPTTKVDSFCQGGVYQIGQYSLSFPSNYYLNLGQNHMGCDSIVSLTLTVKVNKPTILGGKDTVICAGQPCKLTATGGVNYSWSGGFNNGQTFYPSATTWYVVTGYGPNGCSDIDSVKVTVALSPTNPTITNSAGVLSSSAAANNHWYVNGNAISGATNTSYTPTTAGAYKVCVINAAGCKACSNTLNIVFQGIEELSANKQEIYAYPVPFNEELIVAASSNNYCPKCRLMVFNSLGQKVTSAEFNSKELNLPTSNWANGVYLLQVVNSENQMIGQLQVVK